MTLGVFSMVILLPHVGRVRNYLHSKNSRRFRGQNLNTNLFFSNFSGASGISRQNPGISRPKKSSRFPWFRGTYRTFWPPPLRVEDSYPTGKYPHSKVWVCALSSCLKKGLEEGSWNLLAQGSPKVRKESLTAFKARKKT